MFIVIVSLIYPRKLKYFSYTEVKSFAWVLLTSIQQCSTTCPALEHPPSPKNNIGWYFYIIIIILFI